MLLKEGGNSGTFEQVKPGSYLGTCFRIIDLGTQKGEYQGEPTSKRQMFVSWELDEKMEDGKPFAVSAWLTQSLHEKATLRKWLEAWRGKPFTNEELKGFDPKSILGKSCLVGVGLTSGGKSKVSSIMALPKGTTGPTPVNEQVIFSLDNFDQATYDKVPKGIQTIIEKSPEFAAATGDSFAGGYQNTDDDIDF